MPTEKYGSTDKDDGHKRKILKAVGMAALLGAAALSPEHVLAGTPDPEVREENSERAHRIRIGKYIDWLKDLSEEKPELKDVKIFPLGLHGFRLSLPDGSEHAFESDEPLNLSIFVAKVERVLERARETKRDKARQVTEETARGWLRDFISTQHELDSAILYRDAKASSFGGGGAYDISFGKKRFCRIQLRPEENDQKNFSSKLKAELAGLGKGVPEIMARFDISHEGAKLNFRKDGKGKSMLLDENTKSVSWKKTDENDLLLMIESLDGSREAYPVRSGICHLEEGIKTPAPRAR